MDKVTKEIIKCISSEGVVGITECCGIEEIGSVPTVIECILYHLEHTVFNSRKKYDTYIKTKYKGSNFLAAYTIIDHIINERKRPVILYVGKSAEVFYTEEGDLKSNSYESSNYLGLSGTPVTRPSFKKLKFKRTGILFKNPGTYNLNEVVVVWGKNVKYEEIPNVG